MKISGNCEYVAPEEFRILTTTELSQLSDSPLITIGCHTHAHQVLTHIGVEEARRDIINGKKWLESHLGHRIASFSYPYGNYNQSIKALVIESGFRSAVTTDARSFGNAQDPFEIPRIGTALPKLLC